MDIFKNRFQDISEENYKILEEYFSGFDYRGSGYTFLANYIWRNTHCICWEIIGDYLCMAGADCHIGQNSAMMAMPLTKNGKYDPEKLRFSVSEAKKRFDERNIPFTIELIPRHMVKFLGEAFSGELSFVHDRDNDEYVYLRDKLINLSGRALHKKKNHLNYFLKTFTYDSVPITSDMKDEVMDFVRRMRDGRDYSEENLAGLRKEESAIGEILRAADSPEIFSRAIFIDNKIEAFAIGERINGNTAVEHFEKANDSFRGLYQAICREFCLNLPEDIVYVNREEDLGLDNLRKAKEALRPEYMEERYSACFL